MPYSDMLDVGMLVSYICDGVLQPMRKAFFVGLEAGPSTLELGFAVRILIFGQFDKGFDMHPKLTRDCQLSSIIRFATPQIS